MGNAGPSTQKMAEFAAAYRYEDLPAEVVERAKEILLDTMGAMLLGSRPQYGSVRITGDLATENGSSGGSTIFGRDSTGPLFDALLANGTMGYAADAEGGGTSRMHAAAVFAPTVLTVGEHLHSTGRQAIAAFCLAYDVGCRVSDAAYPGTPKPHSYHESAVYGHFGAVAAAGHLLGLDENQFINALGLAGINASGLFAWVDDPTEDSRPFVIGVAAQMGTRAAILAKKGMGGPVRILDDTKYSIYDAYSGDMHLDRLTAGFGTDFRVMAADQYKLHPCCGGIHSGLDALLSLMENHSLQAGEIQKIIHWVASPNVKGIDDNILKSHNSQYILAVAAARGKIEPDDILEDRRSEPLISELYESGIIQNEPSLDEIPNVVPAIIELQMKDGRVLKEQVVHSKGTRGNPFSDRELRDKFIGWATTRISGDQAEQIIDATGRLEELSDVGELTRLLAV